MKKIILVLCFVFLITGCIKIDDINNPEKATTERVGFDALKSSSLQLEIPEEKPNEIVYSGMGYYIKTFFANFDLANNTDEDINFKLRIPFDHEDVNSSESVFAFLNKDGLEVEFQLSGNETKTINLSSDIYKVVGNVGPNEVGGIGGKVNTLLINRGEEWELLDMESKEESVSTLGNIDISLMALKRNYEEMISNLETKDKELKSELEELNQALLELQSNTPDINVDYSISKYSENSGIRKYVGDGPIKAYPSLNAPNVIELLPEDNFVNCRGTVTVGKQVWGMVLINNYGDMKVGFVDYRDLVIPEKEAKKTYIEALGEFQINDRIEKFIGLLDRDYTVISENMSIYHFPDTSTSNVEPKNQIFSGIKSIDVFVGNDFRAGLIRTDSPNYVLKSGFKVGDNAKEVFTYYETNYSISDDNYWGEYNYQLSPNEVITFRINTMELDDTSLIESIWIH